MRRATNPDPAVTRFRLSGGVIAAVAVSMTVMISAWRAESTLGAPSEWPWLLTALQVLALWSAGRGRWWGWLLGGSVLLPWIAYAVLTNQIGFIPGCVISAFVQFYSFIRTSESQQPLEVPA